MNGPVKKRSLAISSNAPEGASAGARSREPEALFQVPRRGVPGGFRKFQVPGGGGTEILSPANEQYAFGTWVARLITAPLNLRARRVHQEGRNDLQLAAVEPTSDSALPIRAKLFGGPDKICTWPPLSPFESSSRSASRVSGGGQRVSGGFRGIDIKKAVLELKRLKCGFWCFLHQKLAQKA